MTDDLISRQAAIEALEELKELDYELYVRTGCCHLVEDDWDYVIRRYKEIIKETPSIQPKTGRWVNTDTTVWDAKDMDGEQELEIRIVAAKCSVCERWAEQVNKFPPSPSMTYNFCPHCGAKLEGEKNG